MCIEVVARGYDRDVGLGNRLARREKRHLDADTRSVAQRAYQQVGELGGEGPLECFASATQRGQDEFVCLSAATQSAQEAVESLSPAMERGRFSQVSFSGAMGCVRGALVKV